MAVRHTNERISTTGCAVASGRLETRLQGLGEGGLREYERCVSGSCSRMAGESKTAADAGGQRLMPMPRAAAQRT